MLVSIEDPGQAVDEQAGLYSYEKSCFLGVFYFFFFSHSCSPLFCLASATVMSLWSLYQIRKDYERLGINCVKSHLL